MSRSRRTTRDNVGMNLFPFLAVLICTMGSLIVLLVVMVQQARVRAAVKPSPVDNSSATDASRSEEDLATRLARHQQQLELAEQKTQEIEDLKWRTSLLQESYNKTVEQLSEQRLALSHIESHTRRLSEDASRLQTEADMIQQVAESHEGNSAKAKHNVSELDKRIASARAELEEAKERLSKRVTKYSLVPYDGPNGTNRRPVYIECLADRVVLQPENVILRGVDFGEPLTNENPLALALRAKREYLQQQGLLRGEDEPYPLLIVRPGSAASYAAARSAMKAWESEFGYELVEADVELDYQVADPRLVRLLEDVVADARNNQVRMIRAVQASRAARRGRQELLRPSAYGGFEPVPGGSSFVGRGSSRFAGRGGSSFAGRGRRGIGSGYGTTADAGDGDPFGNDVTGGSSPQGAGNPRTRRSRFDEPAVGGSGSAAGTAGTFAATSDNPGNPTTNEDGKTGLRDAGNGSTPGPGGGNPSGATTGAQSGSLGQGSSGADGPSLQGANATSGASGFSQDVSLAQTRGQNWALPDAEADAVGITRPIRVRCDPERLVLIPEKGSRQELQVFRHDGSIQAVIDPFVDAVRERLTSWGIAGQGIFWKPVLRVDVHADSLGNYQQLLQLLENSGIEVRRQP